MMQVIVSVFMISAFLSTAPPCQAVSVGGDSDARYSVVTPEDLENPQLLAIVAGHPGYGFRAAAKHLLAADSQRALAVISWVSQARIISEPIPNRLMLQSETAVVVPTGMPWGVALCFSYYRDETKMLIPVLTLSLVAFESEVGIGKILSDATPETMALIDEFTTAETQESAKKILRIFSVLPAPNESADLQYGQYRVGTGWHVFMSLSDQKLVEEMLPEMVHTFDLAGYGVRGR